MENGQKWIISTLNIEMDKGLQQLKSLKIGERLLVVELLVKMMKYL